MPSQRKALLRGGWRMSASADSASSIRSHELFVTDFVRKDRPRGVRRPLSRDQLLHALSSLPRHVPLSALEWKSEQQKWEKPDDVPLYATATFRGDHRNIENTEAVYSLS